MLLWCSQHHRRDWSSKDCIFWPKTQFPKTLAQKLKHKKECRERWKLIKASRAKKEILTTPPKTGPVDMVIEWAAHISLNINVCLVSCVNKCSSSLEHLCLWQEWCLPIFTYSNCHAIVHRLSGSRPCGFKKHEKLYSKVFKGNTLGALIMVTPDVETLKNVYGEKKKCL